MQDDHTRKKYRCRATTAIRPPGASVALRVHIGARLRHLFLTGSSSSSVTINALIAWWFINVVDAG